VLEELCVTGALEELCATGMLEELCTLGIVELLELTTGAMLLEEAVTALLVGTISELLETVTLPEFVALLVALLISWLSLLVGSSREPVSWLSLEAISSVTL
jgi:hypothetical protein